MTDHMTIGSSPYDEPCAQLGSDDFSRRARAECTAFIHQLRRVFGEEPGTARLYVKSNPHDFGTYYEVNVRYDPSNQAESEYAYKLEGDSPATWDDEARTELAQQGVCAIPGCDHTITIACMNTPNRVTTLVDGMSGARTYTKWTADETASSPDEWFRKYRGMSRAEWLAKQGQ